jgi:hypothetical protein
MGYEKRERKKRKKHQAKSMSEKMPKA